MKAISALPNPLPRRVTSSANQDFVIHSLRGDNESNDLVEIDICQLLEFAVAQLFLGAEEAPAYRLPIEVLECFQKAALVASLNGPNGDSGAILQDFAGSVGSRVHRAQSMMW